jgi:inorganic pyrophosphatase/exopolyphosphatase
VQADIVPYTASVAGLLLVAVISMAVHFRKAMASRAGE